MNLDREIEDLLAVDHSPEFLAKVRARVAAEPAPVASWWSWRLVPAGAGLAAVMVVAMLWPLGSTGTVGDPRRTVAPGGQADAARVIEPAPAAAAVLAPAAAPASAAAPVAHRARSTNDAAGTARVARAEAEIVISPEDARALRLLLTRTREGMVVDLPVGTDAAIAGPPWIEIAPVVIEPIALLAQDEGGRQ